MKKYSALVSDSRKVVPGCLFFCKGNNFKTEYLINAAKMGASAYVSETDYNIDIPCILVDDIRRAMAEYSKEFFDNPSGKLELAGLTGTKGKSTTLYFIKSIMEYSSVCGEDKFGYMSTIDNFDGKVREESHLTTPEAIELNGILSNMVSNGIKKAGMEVSSQALKYDRSYGVKYKVGCFINFSEDHISPIEHSDIEDYFNSKLKLIDQCESFVVNLNSDRSDLILKKCEEAKARGSLKKIITCCTNYNNEEKEGCDFTAENIRKENGYTVFDIRGLGTIKLGMPGLFNAENALIAVIMAMELGASFEDAREGLIGAKASGRMEIYIDVKKDIVGIVDFAHNEMAFERIFSSARQEYPGYSIYAVFGCPGNKSFERRVGMPRVAAKMADYCYITEDDPFNENAEDICSEVYKNLKDFGGDGEIIVDREEAIRKAIGNAPSKSVILCLAKGSDTFMHRKNYDPYISDSKLVEMLIYGE